MAAAVIKYQDGTEEKVHISTEPNGTRDKIMMTYFSIAIVAVTLSSILAFYQLKKLQS